MSAAELLTIAAKEGVLLVLNGDRLTWEADHQPPYDLLASIKAHKLELIKALTPANDPAEQEPQHTVHTAATASLEWIAVRDQFVSHLMPCRACHAPIGRYCGIGTELLHRYNEITKEYSL